MRPRRIAALLLLTVVATACSTQATVSVPEGDGNIRVWCDEPRDIEPAINAGILDEAQELAITVITKFEGATMMATWRDGPTVDEALRALADYRNTPFAGSAAQPRNCS